MRKKIKTIIFLLILSMILNMNIIINNKQFVQLAINEVVAAGGWTTQAILKMPLQSKSVAFVYQPSKYKYRVTISDLGCQCNGLYIYFKVEGSEGYAGASESCGFHDDNTPCDMTDFFYKNLVPEESYRMYKELIMHDTDCEHEPGGKITLQVQLINATPALTLTSPTSNSPLQSRQAHGKGAA